ncbi:C-X-C motif chemokine 16 [Carettochelys insculpta]|uniref:C-X-C motif chemokine 16 n=1 Tax=Carettochelys insculpta TaxID=44489 RepID=UPI003EBF3648
MAAPRLALLLLLLLRAPPAWANEGSIFAACRCHRVSPPADLQLLATRVQSYELCLLHLIRFQLPQKKICGLHTADWVVRLRELVDRKAGADPHKGAQKPPGAPARLTELPGRPAGPTEPPRLWPRPTTRPTEPPRGPARSTEPPGAPARPTEPPGSPARPTEWPEPSARPTQPPEPSARPTEPLGPLARPTGSGGGPSLAPWQGEGADEGPPPRQPQSHLMAVLGLLGVSLALVAVVTYLLCRRSRGAPPGTQPPRQRPWLRFHPCELG